jgi:DNA polymerase-3 subunit gamma/tau
MLAFVPESVPVATQAAGAPSVAGASMAAGGTAKASQAPRGDATGTDAAPERPDWLALIGTLKLGGMARMLAQHAELVALGAASVELRVPEAHRHLLEKPYRDKLQSALEEHFGRKLRVEFKLGDSTGGTPAELADRERQSRQQQAIESIDRDPFVRELVEGFDARVVDESIRPLGPEAHG